MARSSVRGPTARRRLPRPRLRSAAVPVPTGHVLRPGRSGARHARSTAFGPGRPRRRARSAGRPELRLRRGQRLPARHPRRRRRPLPRDGRRPQRHHAGRAGRAPRRGGRRSHLQRGPPGCRVLRRRRPAAGRPRGTGHDRRRPGRRRSDGGVVAPPGTRRGAGRHRPLRATRPRCGSGRRGVPRGVAVGPLRACGGEAVRVHQGVACAVPAPRPASLRPGAAGRVRARRCVWCSDWPFLRMPERSLRTAAAAGRAVPDAEDASHLRRRRCCCSPAPFKLWLAGRIRPRQKITRQRW